MELTSKNGIRVTQRTAHSADSFSAGYTRKRQCVREEHWYDMHPYSLAVWPHFFTDNVRRGGWWIQRKNYACIALELQLEGETCYQVDRQRTILKPGELFLTVPGSDVTLRSSSRKYGRQLQLIISGGMVKLLLESLGIQECRMLGFAPEELEALKERYIRIADLMARQEYAEAAANSHWGYEFIIFLAGRCSQEKSRNLPPLLTKAVWSMESDRSCGITINQLAAELMTSRATLTRLFQTYLDTSPQAYWNKLRMESAKQLVAAGQLAFKEIAENLGFRNSLYFSTAFRRYTGQSPSEYRKTNII